MLSFPIARAPKGIRTWTVCVALVLGISTVLIFVVGILAKQLLYALWLGGGIFLLTIFLFAIFDRSKYVRFEIDHATLQIRGDIFGRRIPLLSLSLENAIILDLKVSPEYQPRWKLLGTSVPGYDAGEFSLRNGKSAVLFLSDRSRVLSIPMTDTKLLMLSCENPQKFLADLEQAKASVA